MVAVRAQPPAEASGDVVVIKVQGLPRWALASAKLARVGLGSRGLRAWPQTLPGVMTMPYPVALNVLLVVPLLCGATLLPVRLSVLPLILLSARGIPLAPLPVVLSFAFCTLRH